MTCGVTEDYPLALLEVLKFIAPGGRPRPDGGAPQPRRLQLGLLRAHLPGPAHGHRAVVEGPRPTGRSQSRLHAHDAGLARVDDRLPAASDDDFLDPLAFRTDSTWACRSLVNAYRAGNVAATNNIGIGIADDKEVYPFLPDIIRYYLPETGRTRCCPTSKPSDPPRPSHRESRARQSQPQPVEFKTVNESGGYGMLIRACFHRRNSGRSSASTFWRGRLVLHRAAGESCRSRRTQRSWMAGSKAATSTCGRSSSVAKKSPWCQAASPASPCPAAASSSTARKEESKDTWVLGSGG